MLIQGVLGTLFEKRYVKRDNKTGIRGRGEQVLRLLRRPDLGRLLSREGTLVFISRAGRGRCRVLSRAVT